MSYVESKKFRMATAPRAEDIVHLIRDNDLYGYTMNIERNGNYNHNVINFTPYTYDIIFERKVDK